MKPRLLLFCLVLVSASVSIFSGSNQRVSAIPLCENVFVTNNVSDTVSVVDRGTNTVAMETPVGSGPFAVAVSPDGATLYVVARSSNQLNVIDVATNTVTDTKSTGLFPYAVAVSPDGSKVFVANRGGDTISMYTATGNTLTPAQTIPLPSGLNGPSALVVSPSGTTLYVANDHSDSVDIINIATTTVTSRITGFDGPRGIVVSPNGQKLYVANYGGDTIRSYDLVSSTLSAPITVGYVPNGIAISPDGTRVYVANQIDNSVSVVNTSTNGTTSLAVSDGPYGIAVSQDGARVFVARAGSGAIAVIDTFNDANTVVANVSVGVTPTGIAVGACALSASVTSTQGRTLSVRGTGFNAGSTVNIYLDSSNVGTATANANGIVETTINDIDCSVNSGILSLESGLKAATTSANIQPCAPSTTTTTSTQVSPTTTLPVDVVVRTASNSLPDTGSSNTWVLVSSLALFVMGGVVRVRARYGPQGPRVR